MRHTNYQALLDGDLDVICTALNFPDHRRLVTEEFGKVENIILASAEHDLAGSESVKVSNRRSAESNFVP